MLRETRLRDLLDTAESHTRAGRRARALVFYRKVLALTQDGELERELAHYRLADLHLALGEARRALPHLERAIALSGGEPEYTLMLGRALVALERPAEALPVLHDAAASALWRSEALRCLADALAALGDRPGAAGVTRALWAQAPADPALRARLRELADA